MLRETPPRSSYALLLPLCALLSCGGSHDDSAAAKGATAAPGAAPGAAPASQPIPPPPAEAIPSGRSQPAPEPKFSVQTGNAAPEGFKAGQVLARVNGAPILVEQVYSMYQMNKSMLQQRGRELNENDDRALRTESLQVALADELLHQAAAAKGLKIPPAEIDTALKQFKTRVGSEEAYQKFLAGSGLTETGVRKEMERNFQTEAYRRSLLVGRTVSEADAKKYYDENASKGIFNVPEQVHVQYILVKIPENASESARAESRKRAEEAAKRAAAGEDFGALAKQYSQDPTAERGGDIGLVPRGVMFPKFEEVAFAAKLGEISPVFETPKGWNVMKVLEKKPMSTRTYEEVKAPLMQEMGRVFEQDIVQRKVQELAAAAKIEVLDNPFLPPPPSISAGAAQTAKP